MIRLTRTIEIAAPVDLVWSISSDIERWPGWLSTVVSARKLSGGPFGSGSCYALKQPMQPAAVWEVTACNPGASFTWERQSGSLLQLVAGHEIEPRGDFAINRLSLVCTGPVSGVLYPILWGLFALALTMENRALKRQCETMWGASTSPMRHPS